MSARLDAFAEQTIFVLKELRRGGKPYDLSDDLSLIWRNRLGKRERGLLLGVAIKAADERDALYLRDVLVNMYPIDAADVPPFEVP